MPTDACLYFHQCASCDALLRPLHAPGARHPHLMKTTRKDHRRRERKPSLSHAPRHPATVVAKTGNGSDSKNKGRRIRVRRSGVHGRGVYALRKIKKGTTIIEYKGQLVTGKEAERRHPHDPDDPNHTFFFHIDNKHVIDANVGGNAARWINHAWNPNCESDIDEKQHRVFIKALRNIKPGEELFYDYGLVIDERYTKKLKKQFACQCGARDCRGTMLARRD